jgi:hypothetical protein
VKKLSETAFHHYRHPGESRDLSDKRLEGPGFRRDDDDFSLRSRLFTVKTGYVLKTDYYAFA